MSEPTPEPEVDQSPAGDLHPREIGESLEAESSAESEEGVV